MLPTIILCPVRAQDGAVASSERIVLGAIGIGPRGRHVLKCMMDEEDVQFVAICDAQRNRREAVKATADAHYGNKDCAVYRDMHELLARPDIDAVLIATGDRWHALASILAAKAGKDVYSEKPCGITMEDCKQLADTVKRYGRVFQAGTQRRSIANFQFAVNLVQSGKLGNLHTLRASSYRPKNNFDWLPAQSEPPRDECDWDRWLGPAPWRPYNRAYVEGRWRGYFDFDSGATILDWVGHGARVDNVWRARIGNLGLVTYVFEVHKTGSIDSLLLNLQKAKSSPTVQKVIAVSNEEQLEKVKRESEGLPEEFRRALGFWPVTEVQKVGQNLQSAMSVIDKLGLVQISF